MTAPRRRRAASRVPNVIRQDGRTLIVAMDHGSFMGAARGWEDPEPVIRKVLAGGADAVMTTFGIAKAYGKQIKDSAGLILSTPMVRGEMGNAARVAQELGADCLKTFVAVGTDSEAANLEALWSSALACHSAGVPLLAEMFPMKGDKIPSPTDKEVVKRYARIAAEYGADLVKTFYTGDEASFREVASSALVPVVILGGEKADTDLDLLKVVGGSLNAGGAGVAIGRNIWQHDDPEGITRAISRVVHKNTTPEEAARDL